MNRNDLYNSFNEVDDAILERSDAAARRKAAPAWLKWGAAAACLCLVAIAIPVFRHRGGSWQDAPLRPLDVIEYNGAYYERIDMSDTKTLDEYDLPREITADMIGDALGAGLDPEGEQTEQTFYQYAPYADVVTITTELEQERAQRAVYVVEEDGAYSFALFCNFISFDSNTHTEASEMFVVYGVDGSTDIDNITIGNDTITDPDTIQELFDILYHARAMGNDDYQNTVFKGMGEEEQQALCMELADSVVEVRMETKAGIVINNIRYYPTIAYVSWALNYYKLASPLDS